LKVTAQGNTPFVYILAFVDALNAVNGAKYQRYMLITLEQWMSYNSWRTFVASLNSE